MCDNISNKSMQRMKASHSDHSHFGHQRRLALTADAQRYAKAIT